MKIVYNDGTYTETHCRKSPQATHEERANDYELRGRVAMENDDWHKSEVYYEWARLERLKTKKQ